MKSNSYVEFLLEQFQPLGGITARYMFGGYLLYCDAIPFALVADGNVFLKADDVNRPEFEARGLSAFRPYPDKPDVMQYYETPAEVFEDPEALRHWAGGAVAAGRRAQMKKKPRRKKASA